jgi:hypothetical protein
MTEKQATYRTKSVVEEQPKVSYNSIVKLQSLLDAKVHYTGQETGKLYEWARAGSIVAVDALDAPKLLEKRIKVQSCCNGSDNAIFQRID